MHKQHNTTEHVKMCSSICPQGVSVLLQKQYIIQDLLNQPFSYPIPLDLPLVPGLKFLSVVCWLIHWFKCV